MKILYHDCKQKVIMTLILKNFFESVIRCNGIGRCVAPLYSLSLRNNRADEYIPSKKNPLKLQRNKKFKELFKILLPLFPAILSLQNIQASLHHRHLHNSLYQQG